MKTTKYDPKEFLRCYVPDDCILSIDLLIALHYKAMLGEKINWKPCVVCLNKSKCERW